MAEFESERPMESEGEKEANANGYFELADAEDGVYLTVYPPKGEGEPVSSHSVFEQLYEMVDESLISRPLVSDIIKEAKGTSAKVFEKVKAKVEVLVSRGKMDATLKIIMKKGYLPVTLDEVMEKITQAGVVYGISREMVENAWSNPNSEVVFTHGLAPVDGENAYIKYYVDFENKGKPVELEGGRVDYKNLNNYIIVEKNRMLAQKFLATPGTPGYNVLGESIAPKPGKDVMLPMGKNVLCEDGVRITAERAGHVFLANGKINVSDVIEIKEDIDLSTGNIDFVGSVIIKGTVQAGFTVKAGANVEIYGCVTGGTVEAQNIIIRTGIQGMGRGYVLARENIITKFIENANVYAMNNITVSDVVLNSKVSAGKQILVNGKIIGGTVSAGEKIRTNQAGTKTHVNTTLQVGVNPRLREEYQKLIKEIYSVEENLARMKVTLDVLRSMDRDSLSPHQQNLFLRLTKAQFQLVGQENTMKKRIAEIEKIFEEMRQGRIEVVDTIFPGSKIIVGTLTKIIMEPARYSSFYSEGGDVKLGVI